MAWGSVGEFLAFVAATGLLAAMFNQGILWLRERGERDRKASYLALRIAAILETYVHDALDERSKLMDVLSQKGTPSSFSTGELADFPNEPDNWAILPKSLSGRIMNLKMNAVNDGRYLNHISEHNDPHSLAQEYCDTIIDTAMDAWSLATEIREHFGLPNEGKVSDVERHNRTGVYLENEANKLAHNRREQGIVESADC